MHLKYPLHKMNMKQFQVQAYMTHRFYEQVSSVIYLQGLQNHQSLLDRNVIRHELEKRKKKSQRLWVVVWKHYDEFNPLLCISASMHKAAKKKSPDCTFVRWKTGEWLETQSFSEWFEALFCASFMWCLLLDKASGAQGSSLEIKSQTQWLSECDWRWCLFFSP